MDTMLFTYLLLLNSKDKLISPTTSRPSNRQRQRGVKLTAKERIKVKEAIAPQLGTRITQEKLAENSYVSVSTVKRFLQGKAVDECSAIAILKALNLDYQDIIKDR